MSIQYKLINTLTEYTPSENDISSISFIISKYINNGKYLTYKYPLNLFIDNFTNINISSTINILELSNIYSKLLYLEQKLNEISNYLQNNTNNINEISSILSINFVDQNADNEYQKILNFDLSIQTLYNNIYTFNKNFDTSQIMINLNNEKINNESEEVISVVLNNILLMQDISNDFKSLSTINYSNLSSRISTDIDDRYLNLNKIQYFYNIYTNNQTRLLENTEYIKTQTQSLNKQILTEKTKNKLYNNKFFKTTIIYTGPVAINGNNKTEPKIISKVINATTGYKCSILNIKLQQQIDLKNLNASQTSKNIWVEAPNCNVNKSCSLLSADIQQINNILSLKELATQHTINVNVITNSRYKVESNDKGILVKLKITLYEEKIR